MTIDDKLLGFPPVVGEGASVLILGSMPSAISLRTQQYYAHKQNAFWPIMGALFGALPILPYEHRKLILIQHYIAVWDVLHSCQRPGSLDANIDGATVVMNNFADFFDQYNGISHVFFNGAAAEKLYKKHDMVKQNQFREITYQRLPSTSPAYASLKLQEKIAQWQVVSQSASTLLAKK
ncbi:MAG: DNA-deoxyinosine glycosylase [Methylococcaceae bacterium]|jgi:hypoxanthine-DNA glycosylase